MKVVYFADLFGDLKEEANDIKRELSKIGVDVKSIKTYDTPDVFEAKFDVLFFDWGGMSIGNSLMQSFCRQILIHAEEHPSRLYIMNSQVTAEAMREVLQSYPEFLKLKNIFLNIISAAPYLLENTKAV